jgi:hypothetical protein
VALELLRNNAELAAESKLVGTKFDDNSPAGPMALSVGVIHVQEKRTA